MTYTPDSSLSRPAVALTPRGELQPLPVACKGNKLIVGSAGTGVSFFTKYMLATTYAEANVLFLDSTNTFGRMPSEPLLDWPKPMTSYTITADQTLPVADFGDPHETGITVISIDLYYDDNADTWFSIVERYVAYWRSLLTTSNPLQILVLDRFWTYLLESNGSRGLTLLNSLLKTAHEKNAEVWLLSDGDMYNTNYKAESRPLFRSVIANMDHIYLLDHQYFLKRAQQTIQYLYELTSEDLTQLGTINQNNDPRLSFYREVFVAGSLQARSFFEIYGVVASAEIQSFIG